MNFFQNTLICSLEFLRDKLEERDSTLQNRKRVFSDPEQPQEGDKIENKSTGSSEEIGLLEEKPKKNLKLKIVGYQILDIGVHYGETSFNSLQTTQFYKLADSYVDFP
jgi:hypothetical protein